MRVATRNALDFYRTGENRANYHCTTLGKAIFGAVPMTWRSKFAVLVSFSSTGKF